jgi:hypothetical protein
MALAQEYSVILKDLFPKNRLINTEYFHRGLFYSNLICFQTGVAFSIIEYLQEHNSLSNSISKTIENTFGEKFNDIICIKDNTIIVDSFIGKTVSGVLFYPLDTVRNIIRTNGNVSFSLKLYNGLGYYLLRSVPAFVLVNYIHSRLIN